MVKICWSEVRAKEYEGRKKKKVEENVCTMSCGGREMKKC